MNVELGLDGVDQWSAISRDEEDAREEMVYNLKTGPVSGAIRNNAENILSLSKPCLKKHYPDNLPPPSLLLLLILK